MFALAFSACAAGAGDGYVVGLLDLDACGVHGGWDLRADTFSAEPIRVPQRRNEEPLLTSIVVHAQRGDNPPHSSDGFTLTLAPRDAASLPAVAELTGAGPDRATLALYESCHDSTVAPSALPRAPCPALDAATMGALCGGDFASRSGDSALQFALPADTACAVLCKLGAGEGDDVALAFRARLADPRDDARTLGEARGRIRVEIVRAASAFP